MLTPLSSNGRGAASIHENLEEPRAKGLSFLVARERPIRSEKALLRRVLSVLAVAEHPHCETRACHGVPVHEQRERGRVALEHLAHERGIRHWYGVEPRMPSHRHEKLGTENCAGGWVLVLVAG